MTLAKACQRLSPDDSELIDKLVRFGSGFSGPVKATGKAVYAWIEEWLNDELTPSRHWDVIIQGIISGRP